ncbi:MAG: succinoglycan biosynthesis transport protein ExoP, partial [Porticoccaceae bacterium]
MSIPTDESTMRNSEMEHTFRQALRFLHAIWRRKHIVVATVVVGAIFGGLKVASIEPEPTTYESSGSVLLHQINPDQRANALMDSRAPVDSFREILLSGTVIEAAIAKLETVPPELNSKTPKEQWPAQLRRILTVNAGKNSAIHLRCVSLDAEAPAAVINAMIEASQEFLDKTQVNMSVAMVDSLDKERLVLEEKLFTKERDLFSTQQAIGGLTIGRSETDKHPLIERTMELNKSYLTAQSRRVSMQAALAAIEETIRTRSDLTPHLKPLAELLGDERLQSLGQSTDEEVSTKIRQEIVDAQRQLAESKSFYGPNHPRIVKLTQSLHQNQLYLAYAQSQKSKQWSSLKDPAIATQIHTLVKDAVAVERQREDAIRQIYDKAETEAIQLNGKLAEIEIARREVELLREMHTMVLTRLTGINVNRDGTRMKLFVMDRPPVLGNKVAQASTAKIFPIFVFAGLLIGIAIVYIIDTLDDRFRSPEELKQQLGLELLGVISNLPEQTGVGIDALLVNSTPNAVESEAFRSLRTTIVFAGEQRERLAITSAEPHDGKTTVMGNLAVTYAVAGKRTLIIDADLRSPGLTRLFNMRG